jgi:transcription initiation factor TFIIIB Brf1 subunit/transcription initiation factor TFIIB
VGGLGAYIGFDRSFYFRDRRGKPLPAESQRLYAHLKAAYDGQSRFKGYETTYRCFCALNRVAEILRLPRTIRRKAAYLFRKAIADQRTVEGETSLVLMGYCILLAMREFDRTTPSRIKEIAAAFQKIGHRVKPKSIARVGSEYRDLLTPRQGPLRSEDYVGRILDRVVSDRRILEELRRLSTNPFEYRQNITAVIVKILSRIKAPERGGRNPYVFAASTIYAAEANLAKQTSRRQIFTQKIIAEIAGVAEYSIREHFCSVLKRHSRDLHGYEQTIPSHSPESGPSEGDSNLHLKAILMSRRRKKT